MSAGLCLPVSVHNSALRPANILVKPGGTYIHIPNHVIIKENSMINYNNGVDIYHRQASGLMGSPTLPRIRREDRS